MFIVRRAKNACLLAEELVLFEKKVGKIETALIAGKYFVK